MKALINLAILWVSISVVGQTASKINLEKALLKNLDRNCVELLDETYLYMNDGTSSELFYYALKPQKEIIGTLILLPPTGQTVEEVINNNIQLVELAFGR